MRISMKLGGQPGAIFRKNALFVYFINKKDRLF